MQFSLRFTKIRNVQNNINTGVNKLYNTQVTTIFLRTSHSQCQTKYRWSMLKQFKTPALNACSSISKTKRNVTGNSSVLSWEKLPSMDTSQNMKRKWTQYYDTKPVYVFVFALSQLMPDSIRDKKRRIIPLL